MRLTILLCFMVLLIGLAGGFYLALFMQDQIQLLVGAAIIFAFLNWLGSGTALLGLAKEWYKEKREKVEFEMIYQPQINPHLFEPILEMVNITGQRLNISRKFLKVGIANNGGKVAKQCRATLQFKRATDDTRNPSLEPKTLFWETGETYKDIGIKRTEYLYVVLSDSRLGSQIPADADLFAFISTPETVKMIPANFFRAQDGFGVGDSDFELLVTTESGESLTSNLRVHVTNNWNELTMEQIED